MIRMFEAFAGIGSPRSSCKYIDYDIETIGISEINNFAEDAYRRLYSDNRTINYGDISLINIDKLPDFDLFVAGFPCQDISHNGKQKGMVDGTRSGLVWDAIKIIKKKTPKLVIFENVKNLLNEKFSNDLEKIVYDLNDIGYHVDYKLLNAKNFGTCQNRERVFIVGSLIKQPNIKTSNGVSTQSLYDILVDDSCDNLKQNVKERIMSESNNTYVRNATSEEKSTQINSVICLNSKNIYGKQPSQQYRVYSKNGIMTTLSAQLNGRYNVISDMGFIRKITPKESLLLQDFTIDDYNKISNMENKIYELSGNSIPINMMKSVLLDAIETLG